MELCRHKLAENGLSPADFDLRPVIPGQSFPLASFIFHPCRVAQSIADCTALAIETVAGLIVHSGDFKFVTEPLHSTSGSPAAWLPQADIEFTDESCLAAWGAQGVRLLLADSTNIHVSGSSGSELSVAAAVERIVSEAAGLVVVGIFASNIHRLRALGEIARRQGRRLCLLGRSVVHHVQVATRLGLLNWPSDLVVAPELVRSFESRRVLCIATGSQGETRSALRALAHNAHPRVQLRPGDSVVLSSRIIPGNERTVFALVDELLRLGVSVHSRATCPELHVSGHAQQAEQERLIELLNPRGFVPVHGTLHHLHSHAQLARELGVAEVVVAETGQPVEVSARQLRVLDTAVSTGSVAVFDGQPVTEQVLRQRRQLGRAGVVFVAVKIGSQPQGGDSPRRGATEAKIVAQGVPLDPEMTAELERAVVAALGRAKSGAVMTAEQLSDIVRRTIRRAVRSRFGLRPVVEVAQVD